MPRLFPSLALSLFLLATPTTVYAHPWIYHLGRAAKAEETRESDAETKRRGEEIRAKITEFRTTAKERQLSVARDICIRMVEQRIKAVESVESRVNKSNLTTNQKSDLTGAADKVIADLEIYKRDCNGAETVDKTRTAVNKIRDRHVFKWILHRLHALRGLNKAEAMIGRLNNHTTTIERKIKAAEANGCNVIEAEKALTDYKAALTEAQTHLSSARNIVASVREGEDPGETKRAQIKAEIKAMVEALKKARDAHKKIIAELKECRKTTPSTSR